MIQHNLKIARRHRTLIRVHDWWERLTFEARHTTEAERAWYTSGMDQRYPP